MDNKTTLHVFKGKWIHDHPFDYGKDDKLYYKKNPDPIFKKKFNISKKSSIKLSIACLGFYLIKINNQRLNNYELNNDWTDYSKKIYYDTYEIQNLLKIGENEIEVELGNGMYNPSPLRLFGKYNLREKLNSIGDPKFVLDIYYSNDKNNLILKTDSTWITKQGALVTNNLYLGEFLDLSSKRDGWHLVESDTLSQKDKNNFQQSFIPKIKKFKTLSPKRIFHYKNGIIFDFGEVISGFLK
ncbi:alpha-L-rhamnosidase N-terminal domain-containing protein [Oenococcus alcoholitolerans]|uniref:alpha-L-rhamnosidase N-terminal domain-containing protein n=1 Tax=Oenococcus alcoholitolerans TaxID=931074 RepID=UPI003F71DDA9